MNHDIATKFNNFIIDAVYFDKNSAEYMATNMTAAHAATIFVTQNEKAVVKYFKSVIQNHETLEGELFGYIDFADRMYIDNCIEDMSLDQMERKPYLFSQFNPIKLADLMELVIYKHNDDEDFLLRRHAACQIAPSIRKIKKDKESGDIKFYYFCGPEVIMIELGFSSPVYYVKDARWKVKFGYEMPIKPRIG